MTLPFCASVLWWPVPWAGCGSERRQCGGAWQRRWRGGGCPKGGDRQSSHCCTVLCEHCRSCGLMAVRRGRMGLLLAGSARKWWDERQTCTLALMTCHCIRLSMTMEHGAFFNVAFDTQLSTGALPDPQQISRCSGSRVAPAQCQGDARCDSWQRVCSVFKDLVSDCLFD